MTGNFKYIERLNRKIGCVWQEILRMVKNEDAKKRKKIADFRAGVCCGQGRGRAECYNVCIYEASSRVLFRVSKAIEVNKKL